VIHGFVIGGEDGAFGAGKATADGNLRQTRWLGVGGHGDIGAESIEAGAEVEGGPEEEFGAHALETLFLQGLFDAREVGG